MASDELMEELRNKERPPADRTMPYVIVANHLEEFGTTRAHFGHLSDGERVSVGRRIAIHLSRQRVDGPIMEREPHMFFHLCGDVGIEYSEARVLWYNATEGMQWDEVYAMEEECSD